MDVDLDPPPDGIEHVDEEDRRHVIQIMIAAVRAREEAPLGWSITPQISGLGRVGSIKTGYEVRIWGWVNISRAEMQKAWDGSNHTYLKDMIVDFQYPCPDGESRGCLRLVISSQAGENARQSSQPITQSLIEAGSVLGTAPAPPSAAVPSAAADSIAPAVVVTPPSPIHASPAPPPTPPPPPIQPQALGSSIRKRALQLLGLS